jgi:hypothetical protein
MEIIIKRKNTGSPAAERKILQSSPFDKRYGEWGRVETLHSEDNSVDIYLDSGVHLKRVPVASREWVISGEDSGKDYNSGERNLPPVHARVFVMMPSSTYNDCFIMPFSGFATIDQTKPFMEDDQEKTVERITPSGRHITYDKDTGSYKSISPNEKTSFEIDFDANELHITVFDQITIDVADKKVSVSAFDSDIVIEDGKPILIQNAFGSLGACVKELLDGLAVLHTEGSAASHVASSWAAEKIVPLSQKWVKVFKE